MLAQVPTWDFHGSWGNPELYWRTHKYVTTHFPFWNASGGADHAALWASATLPEQKGSIAMALLQADRRTAAHPSR